MSPHPTTFLGLVLCLGKTIHTQDQLLPRPFIRAEPGSEIPWGQPVTIVCQGPAGADVFRLELKEGRSMYKDQHIISQHGSQGTEARFFIPKVSEDIAGPYKCTYKEGSNWSHRSEVLELVITDEDVSALPSGATRVVSSTPITHTEHPSAGDTQTHSHDSNNHSLSTEYVYILIGVCVAFLLCLLLLVLLLIHHQHKKKHGSPSSKGEEQRPQERLSPAVDIERTPDVATVDKFPEEDKEMHNPSPAVEDPQEVTYAQLDHRALTLRAARAMSPQSTEPTADSSTYAALAIP